MTLREFASMHPPIILNKDYANKEVSIVYYWFHHMMSPDMRDKIQQTINKHDYGAFRGWRTAFNCPDMCYFPDKVYVFCGDFIGELPMSEQAFSMITFSECECG